ncbi:MAG: response regulator transcription factor [Chloroflexi bacterium]|nr:response regulator transcription factor [Chloroflexota bacterium]
MLVIDDEDDVRLLVTSRLKRAGYETIGAADGQEGIRLFYRERPDLVVLDLAMPVMDGWEVLRRLREVSTVPVIMLSARAEERDKIKGLKSGADDYIAKPFSGDELEARVEAALRRAAMAPDETELTVFNDGELSVDFPHHEVVARGERIDLSPTEFRLLAALIAHPGQVLTQEQLLDRVWGEEYAESLDVVRLYIGYLRRKIEADPAKPTLIDTVRGFGYRYRKPPTV